MADKFNNNKLIILTRWQNENKQLNVLSLD